MKVLFLFIDGVGLGTADPQANPFALAELPALHGLLEGRRLLAASAPLDGQRASLRAIDAALGVNGLPQSATGQASLLTGRNIPAFLGYHYGPKPNPPVAEALSNGTLFSRVLQAGKSAAFLNAFPPGYFQAIESGRRMYAAFALAAERAGVRLRNLDDLAAGQAISADLSGAGLRQRLGLSNLPVIEPVEAGRRLARLGLAHDFSLFEYWLSDYAGHGQDMEAAISLLRTFDQALAGLLETWNDQRGLIVLTSDHGNLEDLSTRRHTLSRVPALVVGPVEARRRFLSGLHDLTGVAPAILRALET